MARWGDRPMASFRKLTGEVVDLDVMDKAYLGT